jgi:hypothetical protein
LELKKLQETPDSPEALSCVPTLLVSDIAREAKSIPTDVSTIGPTKLLTHDIATSEILYAEHLMVRRAAPKFSPRFSFVFSRPFRFPKLRTPYHATYGPHCKVGDRPEAH